jgi:hypothetical protein
MFTGRRLLTTLLEDAVALGVELIGGLALVAALARLNAQLAAVAALLLCF